MNNFNRKIDGEPPSRTLRSTSLPDLVAEVAALKAQGWSEDGAMRFGSMHGEATFWQEMKKEPEVMIELSLENVVMPPEIDRFIRENEAYREATKDVNIGTY